MLKNRQHTIVQLQCRKEKSHWCLLKERWMRQFPCILEHNIDSFVYDVRRGDITQECAEWILGDYNYPQKTA